MSRARAVLALVQAWFKDANQELDLKTYLMAAGVGTVMEVPVLYFGGIPGPEIAYTVAMSMAGALGVCMLIELWLHFRS